MKFSQWCLPAILTVFTVFGCTGFYPSGQLAVKRSFACQAHGLILFFLYLTYYCFTFDLAKQFFLEPGEKLNLIYFEFCCYWFVSLSAFAVTILNGGKTAVWFGHVISILRGFKSEELSSLLTVLALNTVLCFLVLPVYVFTSFQTRNQPSTFVTSAIVYSTLCEISVVINLEVMMAKSFLAFILKKLHTHLSRTLRRDPLSDGTFSNRYVRLKNVQTTMRRHHELSILEFEINKIFSVQLLLFTLLNFVELTYSFFYLISFPGSGSLFLSTNLRFIFGSFYFLFYFIQFLQCNISYELVDDQFQKIQDTVNLALSEIDDDDDHLQTMMETFLIQCVNLRVNSKAEGFFQIGHVLIGKMFGVVASSLIILIQFDHASAPA